MTPNNYFFLPLTIRPLDDSNHDPGDRVITDGHGAYVGAISNTLLAEAAVKALNENERLRAALDDMIALCRHKASNREEEMRVEKAVALRSPEQREPRDLPMDLRSDLPRHRDDRSGKDPDPQS